MPSSLPARVTTPGATLLYQLLKSLPRPSGGDRGVRGSGQTNRDLRGQAGFHNSKRLLIPDNITLVPLPAKAPELSSVENVWQFMRDNWLSNRVFTSYGDILDRCCAAWNRLIDQPWRIGLRDWAHRS
jgi:hypothetical protein